MTKTEAINEAIKRVKGQFIVIGTIVATEDEPRTWELESYEGTNAVLAIGDERRTVPQADIFDVKKVVNAANHFLNLGFWQEGMESMILTLEPTPQP